MGSTVHYRKSDNLMMETVFSKLKVGNLLQLRKVTYQKFNSSIVSKGAMNNFNEMFPLARMIPLAVMHRGCSKKRGVSLIFTLTLSSVIFLSVCGVNVFY